MKNGQIVSNGQTIQDARVRGIVIWFYVIAAIQLYTAYTAWQAGSDGLAAAGATFAVADLLIGIAFVVLAYFASKKHPWAFVAGLVLYVLRTIVNLMEFFNPVLLLMRAYLTFRMWQGLQACLAANRADQAMTALNQRRLVMPTSSPSATATSNDALPAPQPYRAASGLSLSDVPSQPWRPSLQQSEPETP
ncbi:MAG TPA: hypothetical protein VEV38_02135 [Candidatus Eremiobacteraceae bacterium]|nr:hypothetical protein [Candidatus Eremiobacteraceae bacterium]